MKTYRRTSRSQEFQELFDSSSNQELDVREAAEILRRIEPLACIEVIEKLGPLVIESGDESLVKAFDVLVNKTIPTRFELEHHLDQQDSNNLEHVLDRWAKGRNAVVFKEEIRFAKNKMALPENSRDEILDAVVARFGKGAKNLVKGKNREQIGRILFKHKALPRSRRKR